MNRTWLITILQKGQPLKKQVLSTKRGVGSLVLFVHAAFPDADYVHATSVWSAS